MIRITNEIGGKKYELVNEICICECCDLKKICHDGLKREHSAFNGCCVCAKLHGIWKEVKDVETTE